MIVSRTRTNVKWDISTVSSSFDADVGAMIVYIEKTGTHWHLSKNLNNSDAHTSIVLRHLRIWWRWPTTARWTARVPYPWVTEQSMLCAGSRTAKDDTFNGHGRSGGIPICPLFYRRRGSITRIRQSSSEIEPNMFRCASTRLGSRSK